MDMEIPKDLARVCDAFRLPGEISSVEPLTSGNINKTYKVTLRDGDREKSYVAQNINTFVFKNPVGLMDNIDKVTTFIRQKKPDSVTLHFHHTAAGKNYLMEPDSFWRVSNFVDSVTFDQSNDPLVVGRLGEAFGEFQMLLQGFDAQLLCITIPDFHDTRKRYARFKEVVAQDALGRVREARKEIDWLLSAEEQACTLIDLYNRGGLPLRVTHNDTKLNNVLFDKTTLEPLVIIDLDTVMPGLLGADFGDAIRVAANTVGENCEDDTKVGLDLDIFTAFSEGFLSKTHALLTKNELDTLAPAAFAITCEIAVRFLTDFLEGDVYFRITSEKQNLMRTKIQVALAKDMQSKMFVMNGILRSIGCRYN